MTGTLHEAQYIFLIIISLSSSYNEKYFIQNL
jgi:hypothetical protein